MKSTQHTIALLLLLLLTAASATAQDRPEPRLVTVAGEAEVSVSPDEVVYDVTVQTFSKVLKTAKMQTDEQLKGLIALARRNGVADADTQTDRIEVRPQFRGNDSSRTFLGYWVRKDLVLTLRDISRAEVLLSELLDSGVWRVNSVNFQTSELRRHRDSARALAMKAAQEKAAALAAAVGQKIGRAYSIEEEVPSRASAMQNMSSNSFSTVETASDSSWEGTLAPGKIKINARVTVKFVLE
ncbi:MAG TPA: SIMPL domain-containing protein [Pyrinomonadaceae bacterium]